MRTLSPVLFLLILSATIHSQFYTSDFYKNHNEKLEMRNEWLFKQRLFPSVSQNSLENGYNQRNLIRKSGLTDNSSSWVSLGPSPGQFNFVDATSRVRVMAYDPNETNIIYIGTSSGGVWKTTNGGLNWVPKTDQEVSLSSGALAVYNNWQTNPPQRIVYYGTGEGGFGFVYSYYGRGLLKSTDGGETWRQITNGLPPMTYFYRIAINPTSPNILLAALGSNFANPVNTGGLYRSTDYGESWSRVVPSSIGEEGLNCTDVAFSPDGSKAYVLGPFTTGSPNWWENGCGYRISNDGGVTFTQVSTNLPGTGYLTIHPVNPSVMYALIANDCNQSSLYRSVDAGISWAWINSSFNSNQCGYNMAVEYHPVSTDIIYVGTLELYQSTDRGNFFQQVPVFHSDIHDIAFNPQNPQELIVAHDGGIAKSVNGGITFTNLSTTITSLECYSVGSDPTNENHILTGTQDNGVQKKSSADNEWKGMTGYDATNVVIDPANPNNYIVQLSASTIGIHTSTNSGAFWHAAGGFSTIFDYSWTRSIVRIPSETGKYYTTSGSKVYVSNDFGLNWNVIENSDITERIQKLAVSPNNTNIMYASVGPFEYMPNASQHLLYKSVNGGGSWINVTGNIPNRYISSINIDEDNENDVIITLAGFGTNHVYHTLNGGQIWISMDCNGDDPCLPDVPFNDFIIYKNPLTNIKEYYAATDIGVFASNGENLWHELLGGLPNTIVMDIEIVNGKLRAATFGRGIFEWNLAGSSNNFVKNKKTYSREFEADNFPNPFNPETEIRVILNAPENVNITIYDLLGREVNVLVNQNLNKGVHKYKWNGSNYSSGIYFYVIKTDQKTIVKKMLLIK